jgi:2-phosphoglycolate phosphatase
MSSKKHALFFDLDGTLINTLPDLLGSLNKLLSRYKRSPILETHAKRYFQYDSATIFKSIFGESLTDHRTIKEEYFKLYENRLTQETRLYEGIDHVLNHLDQRGITWGVVTNKPYFLAEPLLRHFNLIDRANCLVCPETVTQPKPHPEPLLHACRLIGVEPQKALYVGDTLADVKAAKAAHMPLALACYGFTPDYNVLKKEAHYHIHTPIELISAINEYYQ